MRLLLAIVAFATAVSGCAGAPAPPAPGTGQLWGELRLVPHPGATGSGGGGSYGDRRLRDVRLVDYSQPGFAVVYVDASRPPSGELTVTIRSTRLGVAVEPTEAAVGAAGRIVIENHSGDAHVVSHPVSGAVTPVAPGGRIELAVREPGVQQLFLLDVPAASATIFAAPGPFAVVTPSGRFALSDLAPGMHTVHAWHPRLPPASRRLEIAPDASVRVDLELGVGLSQEATDAL